MPRTPPFHRFGEPGGHIIAASEQTVEKRTRAFQTDRKDKWWLAPAAVFVGLAVIGIYSTWAALRGINFHATGAAGNHLLSPFYSPCLVGDACGYFALPVVSYLPVVSGFPFSAAILILWAPFGLRATCYYYRKAYYRAFFADPPGCAVSEPRSEYHGERRFPFILQNLHRYLLVAATVVLAFLWYDTIHAFFFPDGLGVSVGSLVLGLNVVLLSGFTFGCHAFRHLVGGGRDCFTESWTGQAQHTSWRFASWFNGRHMEWAWASLIVVALADLYVRLVAAGVLTDVRLI
jgi:hypothetical protein